MVMSTDNDEGKDHVRGKGRNSLSDVVVVTASWWPEFGGSRLWFGVGGVSSGGGGGELLVKGKMKGRR